MHKDSDSFKARGGLWVVGQSILMIAVLGLGPLFKGGSQKEGLWILGGMLVMTGAWLGIAGVVALGHNRTPYPKPLATGDLVQHGIYARVRHPLYSSVMALSFGWSALWQSLPSLGVAIVTALFFWAKAAREERWLKDAFPHYADYASRVPRFIPRLGRRSRN